MLPCKKNIYRCLEQKVYTKAKYTTLASRIEMFNPMDQGDAVELIQVRENELKNT